MSLTIKLPTDARWDLVSLGEIGSAATPRTDPEILDRVGGGDSFAPGLIYGLASGRWRRRWSTARPTARWS